MSSETTIVRFACYLGLAMLLLAPLVFGGTTIYPFVVYKALVIHASAIVLFMALLWKAWSEGYSVHANLLGMLLLLWPAVNFLAGYLGENPAQSFYSTYERSQGSMGLVYLTLFSFAGAGLFRTEAAWLALFRAIVLSGCVVVVFALFYLSGLIDAAYLSGDFGRLAFTVGNSAVFGNYLAVVCSLSLAMVVTSLTHVPRRTLFFQMSQTALLLAGLIATGSRSGLLAFAITAMLLILFVPLAVRYKVGLAASLCLLLGLVGWLFRDLVVMRVMDTLVMNQAILYRLDAWEMGWRAVLDRPLLGFGPENFLHVFGAYSGINQIANETFDTAHNHLVAIALGTGFVGLAVYLAILLCAQIIGYQSYQKASESQRQNWLLVSSVLVSYQVAALFLFEALITAPIFFLVLGYCLRFAPVLGPFTLPFSLAWKRPAILCAGLLLATLGAHELRTLNHATSLLTIQLDPSWNNKLAKAQDMVSVHFRREETLQILAQQVWSDWRQIPRSERGQVKDIVEAHLGESDIVNLNWRTLLQVARVYLVLVQSGVDVRTELKLLVDRTYQLAPNRPQSHRLLANYYLATGQPHGARAVLQNYLRQNPDRLVMKDMLKRLNTGS